LRIALNIVASLFVLVGFTWFLQGDNVLPGSFMTGQIRWAVYGGIAVAAGIVLLVRANRPAKKWRLLKIGHFGAPLACHEGANSWAISSHRQQP
jgi:hypothetical protein